MTFKERIVPYAIAGGVCLFPAYAFANGAGDEDAEGPSTAGRGGTEVVEVVPVGEGGEIVDLPVVEHAEGARDIANLPTTQDAEGTSADAGEAEIVATGVGEAPTITVDDLVNDVADLLSDHIRDYEALRARVEDGPLGMVAEALQSEFDTLRGMKEIAEGNCSKYIEAMREFQVLEEDSRRAVEGIAAEDISAREQARKIREVITQPLQSKLTKANDLYRQCEAAQDGFAYNLDIFRRRLVETEGEKIDRIKKVTANDRKRITHVEGRVDDLERSRLSLEPTAGVEYHGGAIQPFAGAKLCYGNDWTVCVEGVNYFSGRKASTTDNESSGPKVNDLDDGYREAYTLDTETVEDTEYREKASLRVSKRVVGDNSSAVSLRVGLGAAVYRGHNTVTVKTTRNSQYQNAEGRDLGDPSVISDTEESSDTIYPVAGEAEVNFCFQNNLCLDVAGGVDSDLKPMVRGKLRYRLSF